MCNHYKQLSVLWIASAFFAVSNGMGSAMCTAGTFFKAGTCQPCPKGTYQNVTGSLACQQCPEGTFFRFTGGQGVDVCEPCPAGTFSNEKGAASSTACKKCPTGKNSIEGSPFCLSCPPGQVISFCEDVQYVTAYRTQTSVVLARRFCTEMNLRAYIAKPMKLKCYDCPWSTFSGLNARKCLDCQLSEFSRDGSAKSTKCSPVGCGYVQCNNFLVFDIRERYETESGDRSGGCTTCPPGLTGNKEVGATKCVPCPPGTFSRHGDGECLQCRAGENTKVSGAAFCMPDDTPCPSNFFRDFRGACKRCNKMQRYNPQKKTCEECGAREESTGVLATKCTKCQSGARSSPDGCVCGPGTQREVNGKCVPCLPGEALHYTSCPSDDNCYKCLAGTISRRPGSKKCTKCPVGQVQPLDGQSKCNDFTCPKGLVPRLKRSFRTEAECVVPSTNCPPGQDRVLDKDGLLFACSVRTCPSGTFKEVINEEGGWNVCSTCPVNARLNRMKSTCDFCDNEEKELSGGLDTKCRKCPDDKMVFRGRCECVNNREIVDGKCQKCPRGSTGFLQTPGCVPCPAGTFEARNECKNCKAGTVSASGATECSTCPKGTTTFGQGDANCVEPGSLK